MAADFPIPGSAEDWLRYARSDLGLACVDQPEGYCWKVFVSTPNKPQRKP